MDTAIKERLIKAMMSTKKMLGFTTVTSGVPFSEFMMLMYVFRLSNADKSIVGVRVSKIKDQSHISLPAVSQQLRILEKKGLIERTVTAEDRRVALVSLTSSGNELISKVMLSTDQIIGELIERVGEENVNQYINLTRLMMDKLDEMRGPDDLQGTGPFGC